MGEQITQPFLFYSEDTHPLELRLIILLFYLRNLKNLFSKAKHIYQVYLMLPSFSSYSFSERLESHLHDSVNVFIDILDIDRAVKFQLLSYFGERILL